MGQIVEVVEKPSVRRGIVRFETNRVLSGMGHDRFVAGELVEGDRPVDELARRLFARGGIASIHVNGGVVTVDLEKGYGAEGIADLIRGLYTFYEAPEARPDTVAAEAAVAAAPDEAHAAEAPVLQEVAAAQAAGVAAGERPGERVAARNDEVQAAAEAARPEPAAATEQAAGADQPPAGSPASESPAVEPDQGGEPPEPPATPDVQEPDDRLAAVGDLAPEADPPPPSVAEDAPGT